jgi:hypothetical protein
VALDEGNEDVSIIEVEYGDLTGVRGEDSRELLSDAAVRARTDPEFRGRCYALLLHDRRGRWGFALLGWAEARWPIGRRVPRWNGDDVLGELMRRQVARAAEAKGEPGPGDAA